MLGAFFAIISAATFGFNTATVRRGVLSGSVFQAIAITVPMGVPLFLVAALAAGQLGASRMRFPLLSPRTASKERGPPRRLSI